MIDKNGKFFGKISIIDIFVVIMIVTVAVGLYYKTSSKKVSNEATMTYNFRIVGVRERILPYYEEGLFLAEAKTDAKIGKVIKVESKPLMDLLQKADGTMLEADKIGSYEINMTVTCPVVITDKAYMANGTYELKAGSYMQIRSQNYEVYGKITSIETAPTE